MIKGDIRKVPVDYKKEEKDLYAPRKRPAIIDVSKMNFLAVRGSGNPNIEEGDFQTLVPVLYAVAYTLKMSKNSDYKMEHYFDYVMPPLEGLWWQEGINGLADLTRKDLFQFILLIRLPEFVRPIDVKWAIGEVKRKKDIDASMVEFFTMEEGICVQALHVGSYDKSVETVEKIQQYASNQDYELDIHNEVNGRYHHEIYLSDPRKCSPDRLKTLIRQPLRG